MISRFRTTRTKNRKAFTLLETILAVALSALLIGLIAAGMRIYTRIVADRRADVVNAQTARVILHRIANDLRGAYNPPDEGEGGGDLAPDAGGGDDLSAGDGTTGTETEVSDATFDLASTTVQPTPGVYGNANEIQIDVFGQYANPVRYDMLTNAGFDPMASNLLSDPKVVTYYLRAADGSELSGTPLQSDGDSISVRKTILARRVQGRAQASYDTAMAGMGDAQSGEQMLSDQVVSIQFAYHDGYDWLDEWDSSLNGGLPVAVSITLTVVDEAATDSTDVNTLTEDNIYTLTVRLPAAEAPVEEDLTGL